MGLGCPFHIRRQIGTHYSTCYYKVKPKEMDQFIRYSCSLAYIVVMAEVQKASNIKIESQGFMGIGVHQSPLRTRKNNE